MWSWRTRLMHPENPAPQGFRSLAAPVYRGSTTLFGRAAEIRDTWNHDEAAYTYGSYGTPTTLELAARVCELDGGRRGFVTPGGQSALVLVYLAFLGSGDHVLVPESVYGPSRAFADRVLRRCGVDVEYYDPLEGTAIEERIRPATRLVWCESPGSITMEVQDVPAIAEMLPGFEAVAWYGIVAPPNTPKAVIDKINADVNEALRDPDVQGRLKNLTAEIFGGSVDQTAKYMREEVSRWSDVIKAANIKIE